MVSMWLTTSTWWGFSICKTAHTYGSRYITHGPLGGLRGPSFPFMGKLFILLSVFVSEFSHSLIKFAL